MTRKKKLKAGPMTAEEFKEIRIGLGLTQAQIAKVLGYGQPVRVAEFERGAKNISPLLDRLMRAYAAGYRPEDWPTDEEIAAAAAYLEQRAAIDAKRQKEAA